MENTVIVLPSTALGADERRRLLEDNPGMKIRRAGSCYVLMPIQQKFRTILERFTCD